MGWVADDEAPATTASSSSRWKEEQPRTWWDTARDAGQTADDAVRAAANAMTFGMADRFAGYMGGEGTDAEVKKSEAARGRSPYASIAGDVAGSLAVPGFGAEALAARGGDALLARTLAYGGTGAATGAAQGAGNTYTGNAEDYVKNAALGGVLGGVLGGMGGAVFGRGPATSRAETPNSSQLFTEKTGNYADLATSPALYEPAALARSGDQVEQVLQAQRFHPSRSPTSFQAVEEMRGAPTAFPTGSAPVSPADIEFIRQGMSNLHPINDAADIASSGVVKRALDNFVRNPPPGAVVPGTERAAAEASALAERARGNYGAYKRTEAMEDMVTRAQNSAGSTGSGLNLQNELRKQVRNFVRPNKGVTPAGRTGFNDDEVATLTDYARGTSGSNVLRWAGNSLGGGGGVAGPVIGGVAGAVGGQYFKDEPGIGTAVGVAAPLTGLGLRMIGNRRANTEISQLQDLIAQRSPLYRDRVAAAGAQPGPGSPLAAKATRDAIALEVLKQKQPRIYVSPYKPDEEQP